MKLTGTYLYNIIMLSYQNTGTIRIIQKVNNCNLGFYFQRASLQPHDKHRNIIYITDDLALHLFQTHCRV